MKTDLRIKAKNIRKSLELFKISEKLVELIRQNELYKNANKVMIYYPKKEEVDLRALLKDSKDFYLPRVKGSELEVCPYKLGDNLVKSDFGVDEPVSNPINPDMLDLIIVPALMVDNNNFRLGYGGGYYDRFLSNLNKGVKLVCAIPKSLIIDKLPVEKNDIPVDKIISV